ncbi:mnmE [Scenedesmus sp. PABB004]|nr:mnmE [Scenedesmus sp. PABB004]
MLLRQQLAATASAARQQALWQLETFHSSHRHRGRRSSGGAAPWGDRAAGALLPPPLRGCRRAWRAGSLPTSALVEGNGSSAAPGPEPLATEGEDTIASLVTGGSRSGAVDIIRVSGSDAVQIAQRVFWPQGRFRFGWRPASQRIYHGAAVDGEGRVIDEVLLLAMLRPKSYTREDVCELHTHGGGVCAQRVLRACIEAGARPARPGEFTLRAFLNGRLDLSQAENVLALVNARTATAADSALAGLAGGLGALVSELRGDCLEILAELEARLDFDDDMPPMDQDALVADIAALQQDIEAALRTSRQGSLLRQGLQVAIVGRPNVGKSSLLNAWSRTDRAIVTDIAGTTRDVLEAGLTVGGVPVTLLDTAGIRDSADAVEQLGVERSAAAARAADVVVMVIDAAAGWTQEDREIFEALWGAPGGGGGGGGGGAGVRGPALLVANKSDLAGAARRGAAAARAGKALSLPLLAKETFAAVVPTSAVTRDGLPDLDAALLALAGAPQLAGGGVSWAVNERQAEALVRAHEALGAVGESVAGGLPLDCWTIDLRAALLALGEVSGQGVSEEVLDSVFARFCIGK